MCKARHSVKENRIKTNYSVENSIKENIDQLIEDVEKILKRRLFMLKG